MKPQVIQNYVKPVPDKLGILIDRFNLLPPELDLPSLSVKSHDAANWEDGGKRWSKYKKTSEQWTDAARWSIHKKLEGLPKEFQDYIWGDAKPKGDPFMEVAEPNFDIAESWYPTLQAIIRYEEFEKLRDQFQLLVKFAFKHPSWLKQFEKRKLDKPTKKIAFMTKRFKKEKLQFENFLLPILGNTRFEIEENGVLKTNFDEFSEAVNGQDIRRIRECGVCQRIFWAGRVDKFCCSKKCNLVLNTRLNRVANKTAEQRKEDNRAKSEIRAYKSEKGLHMFKNNVREI